MFLHAWCVIFNGLAGRTLRPCSMVSSQILESLQAETKAPFSTGDWVTCLNYMLLVWHLVSHWRAVHEILSEVVDSWPSTTGSTNDHVTNMFLAKMCSWQTSFLSFVQCRLSTIRFCHLGGWGLYWPCGTLRKFMHAWVQSKTCNVMHACLVDPWLILTPGISDVTKVSSIFDLHPYNAACIDALPPKVANLWGKEERSQERKMFWELKTGLWECMHDMETNDMIKIRKIICFERTTSWYDMHDHNFICPTHMCKYIERIFFWYHETSTKIKIEQK